MEGTDLKNIDLLFEDNPNPMWVYSPDELKILQVNKAALALYGYSRDEMLSLNVTDLWPKEEVPKHIKEIRKRPKEFNNAGVWKHNDKDGSQVLVRIFSNPVRIEGENCRLVVAQNVTPLKEAERDTKLRARQQEVCAELGLKALKGRDIQSLFEETARVVSDTLDNDYCKVLKYLPNEDSFLLKAGIGWKKGHVGKTKIGPRKQSHAGYTLMSEEPIIVNDFEKEDRFTDAFLLDKHNVKSGLATVIPSTETPYGVLATHSSVKKVFTQDDIVFIKTLANILAAATERMSAESLAQRRARHQVMSAELGRKAVKSDNIKAIFDHATRILTKTLGNKYSKILELLPEEDALLLKSGTGYDEELIGTAKIDTKEGSHAGFALLGDKPVVVEDLESETRFKGSDLLQKNNIKSGVSVVIYGKDAPYGIVETHSTEKKSYSEDELVFVETIAHFLGDTIKRIRAERNFKRLNKELEKKVEKRTRELEKANKELESFSYNVSHDLRAPLRAIDGYTSLLLEDYYDDVDEDGKDFLQIVNDETKRMGVLIDDLLSFSRMNRKDQKLRHFSMRPVVDECINEIRQANPDVEPHFEIGELPEVYADPRLIRQVWINLLSNAVKYRNPDRKPEIKVNSKFDKEKRRYVFSVEDNGVGFDMKYVDKLFGVFQRLHSDDEFEGTGIGLALVQKIITRHGGKVWAESELNRGTTMYFSLPEKIEKSGSK